MGEPAAARRPDRRAGRAWRATAVDDDLVEVDYGGYEGRTTAEISEELGRQWSVWRDGTVPGATPGRDAGRGRRRAWTGCSTGPGSGSADGDVALVAHGHVLRVLTARWLGLPPGGGALFALPAGSYGVLGHEHARPVLTAGGCLTG